MDKKEQIKELMKNVGLEAFSSDYFRKLLTVKDLWNIELFKEFCATEARQRWEILMSDGEIKDDEDEFVQKFLDDISSPYNDIYYNYADYYYRENYGDYNGKINPDFLKLQKFTFDNNDIINDLDYFAEYIVDDLERYHIDIEDILKESKKIVYNVYNSGKNSVALNPITEFKKEANKLKWESMRNGGYDQAHYLTVNLFDLANELFGKENIKVNEINFTEGNPNNTWENEVVALFNGREIPLFRYNETSGWGGIYSCKIVIK